MDTTILKVETLSKSFSKKINGRLETVKAVDNVSFSVNKGKVYGLIGASGSGKTTALKLIFDLEKPDRGRIIFKGQDLVELPKRERRKVQQKMGLVLQDPYSSLCPAFKVKDILAEPLIMTNKIKNTKEAMVEIKDILTKLDMQSDKYINKFPHELSGGERQRIAFARALILKPEFLALDEPASMLDVNVKGEIVKLISDLTKYMNIAILLVTHDIALASKNCDYIGIMQEGKLVEEGNRSEVFYSSQNSYTKKLLLAATDIKKYWKLNFI